MIKNLNKSFYIIFSVLLLLFCIPLDYGFSNIALGIMVFISLFYFSKNDINFNLGLYLPIFLYIIMLLSYFWTIDKQATSTALLKEISVLLIPIAFIFFGKIKTINSNKIFLIYAWGIVFYCLIFLVIAFFKYVNTHNPSVFYYHELVSKDLNAIHFSVFVSIAFFVFLNETLKKWYHYLMLLFLGFTLFLLSSKTVIITFFLLVLIYEVFYSKNAQKLRLRNLVLFFIGILSLFFIGKFKDRIKAEMEANTTKSISHHVLESTPNSVNIISMKEAWEKKSFTANDYFPGSAFRVYQARVFYELMQENNVFFKGFGLGASQSKIEEKTLNYNLYSGDETHEGYQKKNFHNQYFQIFAEIGFFGFLIFIVMILYSLKISIQNKNFILFASFFLMSIVFITESFLWRQRGVLFFMTMYCLLHQIEFKKNLTLTQ